MSNRNVENEFVDIGEPNNFDLDQLKVQLCISARIASARFERIHGEEKKVVFSFVEDEG